MSPRRRARALQPSRAGRALPPIRGLRNIGGRSYAPGDNVNGRAPRQRPRPGIGGKAPMQEKPSKAPRRVKTKAPGVYRSSSGKYEIAFRDSDGKLRFKVVEGSFEDAKAT